MISFTKLAILVALAAPFCFTVSSSVSLQQSNDLQEKLEVIRALSKESGLPQVELPLVEVCLTDGCLEAAFDLLRAVNGSVDPCSDFYQFACGRWITSNPVPPSESTWARFKFLQQKNINITQDILSQPRNPEDAKPVNQAKNYFKACMDVDAMDEVGLDPLKDMISNLGGWEMLNPSAWNESSFDWLNVSAEVRRLASGYAFFNVFAMEDWKNSSRQIIYLDQVPLLLPMEFYLEPWNFTSYLTAYETFIYELATELGSTQSEAELRATARSIIALETSLANISSSVESKRDFDRIYNPFSLDQYQTITDGFDDSREFTISWKKYLDQVVSSSGIEIDENEPIIVSEPEYFEKLIPILKQLEKTDLRLMNNYIMVKVAQNYAADLTKNLRHINFRFMKNLSGQQEPTPQGIVCADSLNLFMGMATSMKYVEAYFEEEGKEELNRMVENIIYSFKDMVREADWMQNETKIEAIAKADVLRSFMAYPDWLRNKTAVEEFYKDLENSLGEDASHFENIQTFVIRMTDSAFQKLKNPIDKDTWLMDPITVNARFSYSVNSITFPAGILQPPFFGHNRPRHQNYGGVGETIGHEITHGFDDVGSRFNRFGNLENWWDNVTKEEYKKRSQCMIDQYSSFYIEVFGEKLYVNGVYTLGENIADNGGLRETYKAYQKYVEENGEELRLPGLEALSPHQLFFVGNAQVWCESATTEGLITHILTNPHSPPEFRVKGPIRNSEDFARVYNCPVDPDGMNPPPEQKCTVW